MANTLLSGANIVYNGNPLNDLSLTAFLDKFIEKKPKQSTWHGASEIEPTKKVSCQFYITSSIGLCSGGMACCIVEIFLPNTVILCPAA